MCTAITLPTRRGEHTVCGKTIQTGDIAAHSRGEPAPSNPVSLVQKKRDTCPLGLCVPLGRQSVPVLGGMGTQIQSYVSGIRVRTLPDHVINKLAMSANIMWTGPDTDFEVHGSMSVRNVDFICVSKGKVICMNSRPCSR